MSSLQEKLDAAKAATLLKLQKHILAECEGWADWSKLSEKEKSDTISVYEACFFHGFEACQKAAAVLKLQKHILAECGGGADWSKLSEKEKSDTISVYEACFFHGFEACQKVLLGVGRITD